VPLIEFHNIASGRPGNISETLNIEDDPLEAEGDLDLDDWIDAMFPPRETEGIKVRNTFEMEFTREPVTEYHPYIVSR
jgi:hypothetical protein